MQNVLALAIATTLLGQSSAVLSAEPQRALAAGSYNQFAKVMTAADACGFRAYRTAIDESGLKLLFLDDDGGSFPCVEKWLASHARKLKLLPRFDGDDYRTAGAITN